jgi:hypothetical protein
VSGSERAEAFARRLRAKIPKTRGIGIQIQQEPSPFAKAEFGPTMLLTTESIALGISCIRVEIPSTNGVKRPERPDNNTNEVVAIMPTVLFFMLNLLLGKYGAAQMCKDTSSGAFNEHTSIL